MYSRSAGRPRHPRRRCQGAHRPHDAFERHLLRAVVPARGNQRHRRGRLVDGLLAAIERHKVTVFTCVPTVLTRVVNHPDLDRFDLTSLRMIGVRRRADPAQHAGEGAPKIRTDPGQQLRPDRSHDDGLHLAGVRAVQSRQRRAPRRLHRPALYVRRGGVARTDGGLVGAGETGEITIRSDHVMRGYWRMPAETQTCCATAGCGPATSPAWTTTG